MELKNSNIRVGQDLLQAYGDNPDVTVNLHNIYYEAFDSSSFIVSTRSFNKYSEIFDIENTHYYIDGVLQEIDADTPITKKGEIHELRSDALLISSNKTKLKYGYDAAEEETSREKFFIQNLSNDAVTISIDQIITEDYFTVIGPDSINLASGEVNDEYTIVSELGLPVGTYKSIIKILDSSLSKLASFEKELEVIKRDFEFTVSLDDWFEGELANEIVVSSLPDEVSLVSYKYRGINTTTYEETSIMPTEAGDYELIATTTETENYDSIEARVNFSIKKLNKTIVELISTEGSLTYKRDSNYSLEDFSDLTMIFSPDENVDYEISSVELLSENKVGSLEFKFEFKLTDDDYHNYAFEGNLQSIDTVLNIDVKAVEAEFIVNPLDILDSFNTSLRMTKGQNKSFDLSNYISVDNNEQIIAYSLIGDYNSKVSVSSSVVSVSSAYTGDLITIKAKALAKDINSDGINEYKEKQITIYIKVDEKQVLNISGLNQNENFIYDRSSKSPSGSLYVENNLVLISELEYVYSGRDDTIYNSLTAPTDVGSYTLTYKIVDSNPFYTGQASFNFEIKKAIPNYIVPNTIDAILGFTLADIELAEGFTWQNPNQLLDQTGLHSFYADYSLNNDNYEDITNIEITLNIYRTYELVTSSNLGGTVSESQSLREGSAIELIISPDEAYDIDKIIINNIEFPISNNINLVMDEDKLVQVIFKLKSYLIKIEDNISVILDKTGTKEVNHGDNFVLSVDPKLGFRLLAVKVNGIDVDLENSKLNINDIRENKNINFITELIKYDVVEGARQEVLIGDAQDAEFKINADYIYFVELYINDILLDPSNYTVSEGSTIIKLKDYYLSTLKAGKYNLTAVFSDGGNAETTFTIAKTSTSGPGITNPSTGDSLYTYIALLIISLFAIIKTSFIIQRKKKEV